ncbi:MAG: GNAT family N-acetyltransferase [Anaerolineaceae bacterium]|nr:GNAT family N-acetyltransferase [Anaerolineaceae bacterium]
MKIERVISSNQEGFIQYCKQYAAEHDDSYMPEEDFDPNTTHPSYILMDDEVIIGAVSLMVTPAFKEANKGRFMIFHSIRQNLEGYQNLWDAIQPHTEGLEFTYLFVPESKRNIRDLWESLGFKIQRYSYVLSRGLEPLTPLDLPDGFHFVSLEEQDEEGLFSYSRIANRSFADMAGHVDTSLEDIKKMFHYSDSIEGGLMLLLDGEEPIGTLIVWDDEEVQGGSFLAGISILPEHRGRGFGRMTLRKGLHFSQERGYSKVSLSVNAENENAVKLYLDEGFEKETVLICYEMR